MVRFCDFFEKANAVYDKICLGEREEEHKFISDGEPKQCVQHCVASGQLRLELAMIDAKVSPRSLRPVHRCGRGSGTLGTCRFCGYQVFIYHIECILYLIERVGPTGAVGLRVAEHSIGYIACLRWRALRLKCGRAGANPIGLTRVAMTSSKPFLH